MLSRDFSSFDIMLLHLLLETCFVLPGLLSTIPEGRNMSTIKDEEELYQSLKNISNNLNDNKTAKVNTILMEHLFS